MRNKAKTLYAIQCKNNKGENIGGICGLFKDKEKAKECCRFLCNFAMSGYTYEIHLLITDL